MVWINLKASQKFLTLFTNIRYDTVKGYAKMYKELDFILKTSDIDKIDFESKEFTTIKPIKSSQSRRNRCIKQNSQHSTAQYHSFQMDSQASRSASRHAGLSSSGLVCSAHQFHRYTVPENWIY